MPAVRHEPVLKAGQVVGPCKIVRLLGEGGMGQVYLAEQLNLGKQVAVKVLPMASFDPIAVARFVGEARRAAQIEHANVIQIHDVARHLELHYIVMQYVKGQNLWDLVRESGPMDWRQALTVIAAAARGMAAAHRLDLIHRDIKPANIMLADKDAKVYLMDFGLAREVEGSDLTRTGSLLGTPPYMSPEQTECKKLNNRSDIFSLGGTLYTLLTAKVPYEGGLIEVLNSIRTGKVPPAAHVVNPKVPRKVSEVVAKAMALLPKDRFQDGDAMAGRIEELLRREPANLDTHDSLGPLVESVRDGARNEVRTLEAIEEEEILPVVDWRGRARRYGPWAVAGMLACCLIVMGLLGKKDAAGKGEGKANPPPAKKGGGEAAKAKKVELPGMVFIEEGDVIMGNEEFALREFTKGHGGEADDKRFKEALIREVLREPREKLPVPAFHIDKYEVTNAEYAVFVKATGDRPPSHWTGNAPPDGKANHPVTHITHEEALRYAVWAGKQLPTDKQWVRAFRRDKDWLWPWGNNWVADRANVLENRYTETTEVKATPEDCSFGVYNLVGNVAEMMREKGDGGGSVATRGAWYSGAGRLFGIGSARFRFVPPDSVRTKDMVGFRCVVEAP